MCRIMKGVFLTFTCLLKALCKSLIEYEFRYVHPLKNHLYFDLEFSVEPGKWGPNP